MNQITAVIIAVVALVGGVAIGYALYYFIARQQKTRLQLKAENIIVEAE